MVVPTLSKRFAIGLRGYAAVAVFALTLLTLHGVVPSLSDTERLILAALLAVPLALALFWEHLKGFKLGELEIALVEVSAPIDTKLAAAVQGLKGSETYALVQMIAAAMERRDLRLVESDLRDTPYWWSTRLFLLAALAEEYTDIERFVFVENGAARTYIGMTGPHTLRRVLGARFPEYEQTFNGIHASAAGGAAPCRAQVENIGFQWPGSFPPNGEASAKLFVTAALLREWLGDALETERREWDGSPATSALYARILSCKSDHVPLLQGARLEIVVRASDLARRIARSALS
jgi:hypothetical protein